MQTLQKILQLFKQIVSDTNGNPSSARIAMLIIVLWFLADFHQPPVEANGILLRL